MLWILMSLLVAAPPDAETKRKVRRLIDDLKDEKSPLVVEAARKLGQYGPAAEAAIPALRLALKAKTVEVRSQAAAALLLINENEAGLAFPVLLEVFKDHNELFA